MYDTHVKGRTRDPMQWTMLQNEMLGTDGLARRGLEFGIDRCIFVNQGTFRISSRMDANTIEAIIGAVFEDRGDDAVMTVMKHFGFLGDDLFMFQSQQ